MKKNERTLLGFAVLGTLIVLGMAAFGYVFLRDPKAPSAIVTEPSVMPPTQEVETQATEESESSADVLSKTSAFRIAASQSEARFTLNELLGGEPTTVIGKTQQVSGQFIVDLINPQDAQVGEILINARDLTTDNSFRNRAIHNQILDSNTYEFISFVPAQATLLPETINFGESVALEISGALTIKGVTQQVTFTASITPISETQIEGHAEAMLRYSDFGINIPSAPRVAEVDEEVFLEIDFVALLAVE